MPDPDQQRRQQTADVVLYWMRRRGMTRQVFANRLGRSVSWVDKIRAGDRQLDRLSVLRRIATVLEVPLNVLIDPAEAERRKLCPDEREIEAVRRALSRYDVITNVFRPSGEVLPEPDLLGLERRVRYGWMAFQAANYQVVGQMLGDLIRDAQAAVWQLDSESLRTAQIWLAWTYQLAAAAALKLGDAALGWLAADRGIQVAEQTADLTLIGGAARRVAHALSATGQSQAAVTMVHAVAGRLQSQLAHADPAFISAYGMLLLKGSIAAAQLGHAADVRDLQHAALEAALRLRDQEHNEHWSAFGATNVRVHEVSALADMQGGGLVIEAAARIHQGDLIRLPRERRASYLLDVTRGHLQSGKRDDAAQALLEADQLAPEEVRCRRMTRKIVRELVQSYPGGSRPSGAILTLARAVGVVT